MSDHNTIKNNMSEGQLFLSRSVFAMFVVVLLTLVVVVRLIYLQVQNHEHYANLADNNRVKIEALPPTRGLIYDRNGVLLADNQPSYSLELIPEQVKDLEATLTELGNIVEISEDDLKRFNKFKRRKRRFESVPVRFKLTDEEVSRFAVQRHRFPGVDIHARLYRHYPYGELTAHILGYVGRIDEKELGRVDAADYAGTDHIGKVGVEKFYEDALHGDVGFREVETNVQSRVIRVLRHEPPSQGQDLYLNLDIELQKAAWDALGEKNGSVVAIDPRTGGVLALVSRPGFDPNPFVNGISSKAYKALYSDPKKPMFNRALRGQYPPGSTIKPLMGMAGIEHNLIDPDKKIFAGPHFSLPGSTHRYRDWKKGGHGLVDLELAIAQSCDVYFYQLAVNLGIDRMHSYLGQFGLGARSGIDLPGELPGLNPSRAWKRRARNQPWYPGETVITGIGQGYMLSTPVQLAVATAALANGGRLLKPQVVNTLQNGDGSDIETLSPDLVRDIPIKQPEAWQRAVDAMHHVVHGPRGTARKINKGMTYEMAGKTGTAQVYTVGQDEEYDKKTVAEHLKDHGLFIAFAPVDNPSIALAVIVENGGGGSSAAAPVARKVMDNYLNRTPQLQAALP